MSYAMPSPNDLLPGRYRAGAAKWPRPGGSACWYLTPSGHSHPAVWKAIQYEVEGWLTNQLLPELLQQKKTAGKMSEPSLSRCGGTSSST